MPGNLIKQNNSLFNSYKIVQKNMLNRPIQLKNYYVDIRTVLDTIPYQYFCFDLISIFYQNFGNEIDYLHITIQRSTFKLTSLGM